MRSKFVAASAGFAKRNQFVCIPAQGFFGFNVLSEYHGFSNKTLLIRNAIKAVTVKKRPKFFSYRPRVALSYRPRGGRRRGRAAAMAGQGRPLDGPPRKKKNREKKICGPKARKFFFRVRYGRLGGGLGSRPPPQ